LLVLRPGRTFWLMIHLGSRASEGDAQKRQRMLERKRKSQARKAELAREIDDGGMLCAALAFYLSRLEPGLFVHRPPEEAHATRRMRKHLRAARHLLGIFSKKIGDDQTLYRLPKNFAERLRTCTGLDARAFTGLNPNLEVDETTRQFALDRPRVLDGTRRLLNGGTDPGIERMTCPESAQPPKPAESEGPPSPMTRFVGAKLARQFPELLDQRGWQ
jgi:hypothetical protein